MRSLDQRGLSSEGKMMGTRRLSHCSLPTDRNIDADDCSNATLADNHNGTFAVVFEIEIAARSCYSSFRFYRKEGYGDVSVQMLTNGDRREGARSDGDGKLSIAKTSSECCNAHLDSRIVWCIYSCRDEYD